MHDCRQPLYNFRTCCWAMLTLCHQGDRQGHHHHWYRASSPRPWMMCSKYSSGMEVRYCILSLVDCRELMLYGLFTTYPFSQDFFTLKHGGRLWHISFSVKWLYYCRGVKFWIVIFLTTIGNFLLIWCFSFKSIEVCGRYEMYWILDIDVVMQYLSFAYILNFLRSYFLHSKQNITLFMKIV